MGERHHDLFDAAGLRGHQHAAVAHQKRLFDRMGDVDDGLARFLPERTSSPCRMTRFCASSAANGSSMSSMPDR